LGGEMLRERSGCGVEEGSMKIPSKGIFINRLYQIEAFLLLNSTLY
jgi:hypothetical protein